MRIKTLICLLAAAVLASCSAQRAAIKRDFDFSKVRTIGMGDFLPRGPRGELVKSEFTRQFMNLGFNVRESVTNVDLVLSGSVTEYLPSKRYLFYAGESSAETQVVIAPSGMEISGSNVYNLGPAFGAGTNSQIMVSNATAGVSAKLVDPASGDVVWANSYAYEGLDIQTAVENVVNYLSRSIIARK